MTPWLVLNLCRFRDPNLINLIWARALNPRKSSNLCALHWAGLSWEKKTIYYFLALHHKKRCGYLFIWRPLLSECKPRTRLFASLWCIFITLFSSFLGFMGEKYSSLNGKHELWAMGAFRSSFFGCAPAFFTYWLQMMMHFCIAANGAIIDIQAHNNTQTLARQMKHESTKRYVLAAFGVWNCCCVQRAERVGRFFMVQYFHYYCLFNFCSRAN